MNGPVYVYAVRDHVSNLTLFAVFWATRNVPQTVIEAVGSLVDRVRDRRAARQAAIDREAEQHLAGLRPVDDTVARRIRVHRRRARRALEGRVLP